MKYDPYLVLTLVGRCGLGVLLLGGLLGLWRFRSLAVELRWLVGGIWFALAMETVAGISGMLFKTNLWTIPIDAAGEFVLLSVVFARALRSPTFARVQPWLAAGFVFCAMLSTGFTIDVSLSAARFAPALQVLESVLVLGLAGLYFRKLLNELRVPALACDPLFWVSAGLIIYFLSKMLIALFSNFLLKNYSSQLNLTVWTVHGLMALVLYLCYLRALWLRPQK